MKKIYRFEPGQTRNSEFQTLYQSVIRIADTFDAEALHIGETLKTMKEALPQVEELNEKERKKPLTQTMNDMRAKRKEYVSFLVLQTKAQLKSDDSLRTKAAAAMLSVVTQYLSNIDRKSYNAQLALINQFVMQVEADELLKQSLTTLGLVDVFEKLKVIQETLTVTHDNRIQLYSKRKKFNAEQTKRDLYRLMTNLFTSIEGAALAFPDGDYEPLINQLNSEIELQRTTYQQRRTRSTKVNKMASLKISSDAKVS